MLSAFLIATAPFVSDDFNPDVNSSERTGEEIVNTDARKQNLEFAQRQRSPRQGIVVPKFNANRPRVTKLSYKITAVRDGFVLKVYSSHAEALPRPGYKLFIGRGDYTFQYAPKAFLPGTEQSQRLAPLKLFRGRAIKPEKGALAQSDIRSGKNIIWTRRILSNLTNPKKRPDGQYVVTALIDGLRGSTNYCIAANTGNGIEEVGCRKTPQYLNRPQMLEVKKRETGHFYSTRDMNETETSLKVQVLVPGKQGPLEQFIYRARAGSRYVGHSVHKMRDGIESLVATNPGTWCITLVARRAQIDRVIESKPSQRYCQRLGTDTTQPSDPPPPQTPMVSWRYRSTIATIVAAKSMFGDAKFHPPTVDIRSARLWEVIGRDYPVLEQMHRPRSQSHMGR